MPEKLNEPPDMNDTEHEVHEAVTYHELRDIVRDLQQYADFTEQQVANAIGWNSASMNRFMNGQTKTMPHHTALLLHRMRRRYREGIDAKKIELANALMASVSQASIAG